MKTKQCEKFKVGDRVWFRGALGRDGKLMCVYDEGRDVIEATITSKPQGRHYELSLNGKTINLPFFDSELKLSKK